MIQVNAMGDPCPVPVVKTMNVITGLKEPAQIEVLVDNDIAVQNLTKMANHSGYSVKSEKLAEKQYRVEIAVDKVSGGQEKSAEETESCIPDSRQKNTVVVISSSVMGSGDDELGAVLMKGFIYALSQQESLPATIIFYNGGARLTCEDAPTLEDLKSLEAQGVEILTCGTCLNHYGLADSLRVGGVTNMYTITEKLTQAGHIIKP